MNRLEIRIRRIRDAIREIRANRPFVLGPTLDPHEVLAFEVRNNLGLPDGFRRFVLEIGNGGDGPTLKGWPPFDPTSESMNDVSRWAADFQGAHFRQERDDRGYVIVGEHDNGPFDFLVITGNERGSVWWSDGKNRQTPARLAHDPRMPFYCRGADRVLPHDNIQSPAHRVGFLDYYANWLQLEINEIRDASESG